MYAYGHFTGVKLFEHKPVVYCIDFIIQHMVKHITILFISILVLTACRTTGPGTVELELATLHKDTLNTVSIYATNKPELMQDRIILFWDKWGLNTYTFENISPVSAQNTFRLEGIKPGKYSFFIVTKVKDLDASMSAELKDIEVIEGDNTIKRKLTFIPVRTYTTKK
jgi:hypothetical protein